MMSDMVSRTSGLPKLDENDAGEVYRAIMDPDQSLAFTAAIIRKSIDDYRKIAGMDISRNPGLTATLYNIGNSKARARANRRSTCRCAWRAKRPPRSPRATPTPW